MTKLRGINIKNKEDYEVDFKVAEAERSGLVHSNLIKELKLRTQVY